MARHLGFTVASVLLAAACAGPPAPVTNRSDSSSASPIGFVNKVWQVRASTGGEPGALYVFLSDGTLVMTSTNTKPTLGTWTYENGAFTMVEEGIPYKVDVVELTPDTFKIRSHNPGQPVDITFGLADEAGMPGRR